MPAPVPAKPTPAPRLGEWRREALAATLWLVPSLLILAAVVLFAVTHQVDRAAYRGDIDLPAWVDNGSADAARQILTALAAAIITVVGLVFSITIVALTLASTQFGPRMLRNFLRDRGTQVSLGAYVATFVYVVLALGSIAEGARGDFVPHLSITAALALVLVDLAVLVYFIHHVATSIQLPHVVAGIAHDLTAAIEVELGRAANGDTGEAGLSEPETLHRLAADGEVVHATTSGYVQFIGYPKLVEMAARADGVIQLLYRPGHFVVEGLPLARVWPAEAAGRVARGLARAHATGAYRTLSQDLTFAIDQLVEIALRALSPAVNDVFTALTCIDWLGDALCKLTVRWDPARVYRDRGGHIRLIAVPVDYPRLVDRAFDKIRQAGRGMPAVMIRQLDALAKVMAYAATEEQRDVLRAQAAMILRAAETSVPEPGDVADVRARHAALVAAEPLPVR